MELNMAKIHSFAQFWLREYQELPPLVQCLFGRFPDICRAMGFEMDSGESLRKAFPEMKSLGDIDVFERIVGKIDDVQVLGNAIFSFFMEITNLAQDSLCTRENQCWFCLAFARLAELTAGASPFHITCEAMTGDITRLDVDAIVNAANCGLLGGGAVRLAAAPAAAPRGAPGAVRPHRGAAVPHLQLPKGIHTGYLSGGDLE